MTDADELLRTGDLQGARAALVDAAKRAPTDQAVRMFLFQLLCLLGEWDKALAQLRTLATLSPEAQMLSATYSLAIEAEKVRATVFAGGEPAALLVASSTWAGGVASALGAWVQGREQDAKAWRDEAFDSAPDTPGELNGVEFDWIADGDGRFGPTIEAIIAGRWGLIPFDSIERMDSEGPKDLRDLVWLPAQIIFRTGHTANAMLPVRYPGAESSSDSGVRLARRTDWREDAWGPSGSGQHEWSLSGGQDASLLSLRRLTLR